MSELFDNNKIKQDFPLLKDGSLSYLDNAASSQTPEIVIDAIEEYYKTYRANVHRGLYSASEKATEKYEQARGVVAQFIGAGVDEIVFTSGATMSSNMLILALENTKGVLKGNTIVTTVMEHNSSFLPLKKYAERTKKNFVQINLTESMNIDYDELENKLTKDVAIVSVTFASNILGTINDIQRISKLAHKVEALLIVDATAAVGHIPINVKKFDVDFLYFSGHKMCGPTGIGVLYGKKELLNKLEPGFYGGGMVSSIEQKKYQWVDGPQKFESGTPNIEGAIGLSVATTYLNNLGLEKIHTLITKLTKELILEIKKIDGVTVFTEIDEEKNIGIVSFTMKGIHPHDIAQILAKKKVAVRAGHHCSMTLHKALNVHATVRVSIYLYNTKEDIQKLVSALKEVKRIFLLN